MAEASRDKFEVAAAAAAQAVFTALSTKAGGNWLSALEGATRRKVKLKTLARMVADEGAWAEALFRFVRKGDVEREPWGEDVPLASSLLAFQAVLMAMLVALPPAALHGATAMPATMSESVFDDMAETDDERIDFTEQ